MSEWWTYTIHDFLLFSPRVYWRMFELHNEAVWPSHVATLLLGATILAWVVQPRPWSDRAVSAIVAGAWIWVAWTFLWNRYATINWASVYAVPAFVVEALLIAWFGGLRNRLRFAARSSVQGLAGLALFLYALVLHPFVAKLAGRPLQGAEVFGISPDPTAIATLGLLSMAFLTGAGRLLLAMPMAWCLASSATLHAMGAPEAWIPLAAVALSAALQLCPSRRRVSAT